MDQPYPQYAVRFSEILRPDFLGLPEELARALVSSKRDLVADLLCDVQMAWVRNADARRRIARRRLGECVNYAVFRVENTEPQVDFRAYIADGNEIIISAQHREKIKSEFVRVSLSFSQEDASSGWRRVQEFIDASDLPDVVKNLCAELDHRTRGILFRSYGIYGCQETTDELLADELGLSPDDVCLVRYEFCRTLATRLRLMRRRAARHSDDETFSDMVKKASDRSLHLPEALLADWLRRLVRICQESRVSLQAALGYISAKFPSEHVFLNRTLLLGSYDQIFRLIGGYRERYVSVEVLARRRPLVEDSSVIERLKGVNVRALPLPARTIAALTRAGIENVDALVQLTYNDLLLIPNLGRRSISSMLDFFKLYKK
jgi:hypothetical protein